jgi:nucleotide-binding universal stress UspA family protein
VEGRATAAPDGPLIVGVDERERSRDAIALGQQLAMGLPGALMPVYVHTLGELDALMTGADPDEVGQLVAADAKAKHAQVEDLADKMGISGVQLRQATSVSEGLHEQAVETSAAVVVIGSSSRSGLGRVLPGGTAERLLSGSPVPVAVAPTGFADREMRRDVMGVGFDNSSESGWAVRWAAGLAAEAGASLRLLAVHVPAAFGSAVTGGAFGTQTVNQVLAGELQSETEQLAEALSSDLPVDAHLLRGDPKKVLVEQSQQLDLLVLGSRGYGPLKSVLLGSVSSYVVRNSACPVLIVPRGGDETSAAG